MMRALVHLLLLLSLALTAGAAPAPRSFEALLIRADGSSEPAFLLTATKVSIRYRTAREGTEIHDRKISELAKVHFTEPAEYRTALDLFQARRYHEAKEIFAELRNRFEAVATLPDNPGSLAAFHELECLRKLGDLEGLSAALQKFNKDPLVRENHQRQIEMYIFWDAVRTKNWSRLDALAKERQKQRLPGFQRAQVAYCHALALEGLNRPKEALDAYDRALTADIGASEEIARKSALAILRIHLGDPAVKEALKRPDALPDPKTSPVGARIAEARAVAKLFQLSLGSGEALPAEYQILLKD